jgi:hypothetical protein
MELTSCSAQCNSFHHISRTADTTIDEQLELLIGKRKSTFLFEFGGDFNEHFETRPCEVKLTSAMI